MANLKNEGPKRVQENRRSWRAWGLAAVLVIALLAAAPSLLGAAQAASASGRTFEIEFTKWVTEAPHMMGVVEGDVGPGSFEGEILNMNTEGDITTIEADYHISGSKHSLSARIQATQDDPAGTGEITGQVTSGWLQGRSLTGRYKVFGVCPISTGEVNALGTVCFQGTLELSPAQ